MTPTGKIFIVLAAIALISTLIIPLIDSDGHRRSAYHDIFGLFFRRFSTRGVFLCPERFLPLLVRLGIFDVASTMVSEYVATENHGALEFSLTITEIDSERPWVEQLALVREGRLTKDGYFSMRHAEGADGIWQGPVALNVFLATSVVTMNKDLLLFAAMVARYAKNEANAPKEISA